MRLNIQTLEQNRNKYNTTIFAIDPANSGSCSQQKHRHSGCLRTIELSGLIRVGIIIGRIGMYLVVEGWSCGLE